MEKDATSTTSCSKSIIKHVREAIICTFCVASSMLLSFGVYYFSIVGIVLINDEIKTDEKTFVGSVIILCCTVFFICCTFYAFKRYDTKRFIFIYVIPVTITFAITYAVDYGII